MYPLLIYIHGFKSSHKSQKAQEVRQYLEAQGAAIDYLAPCFSNYPGEAYQQLVTLIEEEKAKGRTHIALIGSSMGGFVATVIAETMGIKAVLVNPAVHPHKLVGYFLGENINPHTNEVFILNEGHVTELEQLEVASLTCGDRLMVMLQTGDESLDYRVAEHYYKGCTQMIEEGGSHRFENFDKHFPSILKFLELM